MITARRATNQKVTRNSSHFKKLPNPPGSTIPDTETVPADGQVPLDFEGSEVCQPSPTSAPQEESSQAQPSDTNGNKDNITLAAAEQSTHSPPISSCSGRLIKKPSWMKDYVMSFKKKTLLIISTFLAMLIMFYIAIRFSYCNGLHDSVVSVHHFAISIVLVSFFHYGVNYCL